MADYVPMMIAGAAAGGVFALTGCFYRNGEDVWTGGALKGGLEGAGRGEPSLSCFAERVRRCLSRCATPQR